MSQSKGLIASIIFSLLSYSTCAVFYLLYARTAEETAYRSMFFFIAMIVLSVLAAFSLTMFMKRAGLTYFISFYTTYGLLLIMQIAFTALIIYGAVIASATVYPHDVGLSPYLKYGAVHIALIAWGFINVVKFAKTRKLQHQTAA